MGEAESCVRSMLWLQNGQEERQRRGNATVRKSQTNDWQIARSRLTASIRSPSLNCDSSALETHEDMHAPKTT